MKFFTDRCSTRDRNSFKSSAFCVFEKCVLRIEVDPRYRYRSTYFPATGTISSRSNLLLSPKNLNFVFSKISTTRSIFDKFQNIQLRRDSIKVSRLHVDSLTNLFRNTWLEIFEMHKITIYYIVSWTCVYEKKLLRLKKINRLMNYVDQRLSDLENMSL